MSATAFFTDGHALLVHLRTSEEEFLRGVIVSCSLGGTDRVAVPDSLLFREPRGSILNVQESKQQLFEGNS